MSARAALKTADSFADPFQYGCIVPLLYRPADRIGQDSCRNADDPDMSPSEKQTCQKNHERDSDPVNELKPGVRFIQLSDNIRPV